MMRQKTMLFAAAFLLSLQFTCLASAQTYERLYLPPGVFYYQPASTVFGTEAAWINPGGLGRYRASGGQLMADYFDQEFVKSWGGVASFQDLALAYRSLHNPSGPDYHEYLFASGVPVGKSFSIGGSYRYFKDGPGEFQKRHLWTVGLLKQGESPVSWAAVFSNLNESLVNGRKSLIEQRYSIGYQPMGSKFTLAVDMMLSTKTRFADADFVYSAEYTPIPGLFIDGYIDSHKNFQLGLRANLLKYFVGSKSTFTRKAKGLGTTAYVGISSLRQPSILKDPPKRLNVGLSGSLPENPPQPIIGNKSLPYASLLLSLYRAASDPYINDVVIYMGEPALGFARAQEIRDAIQTIRRHGKRVICHLNDPGNLTYYTASAADEILVPPVSQVNLVGLRAELTFYAGTMDKLGIKADVVKIGAYKTAAEPYTRSASSDENRAQLNRVLDGLYAQFVDGIAAGRGLSADSVRRLIDEGPFTSVDALNARLVDGLCYADQVDSTLGNMRQLSLQQYLADTVLNYDWRSRPVLAVVVAAGDIADNPGGSTPFDGGEAVTPSTMARGFDQANRDHRVAAIIMRIDSPGGEALASDEIFHVGQASAERKPLYVSMANTAASGGFYAAMPAKRLFASPGTLTGSVGIFGGKPDFSGLYQKIALGKELYTRGSFAGMMSSVRPFTTAEREKYFSQIKAFYDHFVDLVAANRALSRDSIDALGRGQVWTGAEAKANGLVDQIGGFRQTLDYAARETGTRDFDVVLYPIKRPLFVFPARPLLGSLFGLFGQNSKQAVQAASSSLGAIIQPGLYARVPFDLVIQ